MDEVDGAYRRPIIHSSVKSFDSVDPEWRTYCGLTADALAELVVRGDAVGQSHSWKPDGQMTCAACRSALPASRSPETVGEWLR